MIKHRHIGKYRTRRGVIKRRPMHPIKRSALYRQKNGGWELAGTDKTDRTLTENEITERFRDIADATAMESATGRQKGLRKKRDFDFDYADEHFPVGTQVDKIQGIHQGPRFIITKNDPADNLEAGAIVRKPSGRVLLDSHNLIPKKLLRQAYSDMYPETSGRADGEHTYPIHFSSPDFTKKAERLIKEVSRRRR